MKTAKHIFFVLFFSLGLTAVHAQLDRIWVNTYDMPDTAYMNVVNLFDGGNGSVVKVTMLTKQISTTTYNRLLIQKIDPAGNVVWDEEYTHPIYNAFNAYKAGSDAAGNIYLSGQVTVNQSTGHWFVISFDAAGQFRWKKEIVENTFVDGYSQAITVDDAGNVYVSGVVSGNGNSYGVIVKYDNNGSEQWVKKDTVNYYYGLDMIVAENGDLIASDGEYKITRFSPAGNILWSTPDTAQWIYVNPDLVESADGSIYAISFLGYNYSLKKLSASGTFEWNKQDFEEALLFGDYSIKIVSDAEGNIYACGLNSTDSIYQTAVFKINPSGQEVWRQTFQNINNLEVYDILDMLVLPNGNIALCGSVYNSNYYAATFLMDKNSGNVLDVDTIDVAGVNAERLLYNSGGLYVAGNGNYSTSLIKYASSVSIKENEPHNVPLDVYPNPFIESISIQSEFLITKYELRNISGQIIKMGNANGNITLSLSDISSGIYLLNVYGNDGQQAFRRIIKR